MDQEFYIATLIAKQNEGTISSEEQTLLTKWVQESEQNEMVYKKATEIDFLIEKATIYALFNEAKAWQSVESIITETKVIPLFSKHLLRYAAVLIPLVIAISLALFFFDGNKTQELSSLDETAKPGTEKAILILEDGKEIDLSQAGVKESVIQGKSTALIDGKNGVSYHTEDETSSSTPIYNELIIPKGGKYNIILTDGTKIWLNAGSSLRFPVAFTDTTRTVFLTGEAYFEVSHHEKPFIVTAGGSNIRVLGTVFNISSYSDDDEMKTTLAEGSVKITPETTDPSLFKILAPGEQATIESKTNTMTIEKVNVDNYTSWVDNKLEFNNEKLENVMKRLSRWYDFPYQFENDETRDYHFTARFENKEQVSSILEMLEMTTNVKFEIVNQTVIIK